MTLLERATDYFERQIEWLETLQNNYETIEYRMEERDIERIETMQQRFDAESREFERELQALSAEWEAASLTEDDRAAIAPLARRAETLANEVAETFRSNAVDVDKARDRLLDQFTDIHRGKRLLGKYRTESEPRFVDREA